MSDLFQPTVLILLSEQEGHGYDLRARMTKAGVPTNTGGLYRTLIRMAEEGLIEPHWDGPDRGPARRVYSITTSGRTYLDLHYAPVLSTQLRTIRDLLNRHRKLG